MAWARKKTSESRQAMAPRRTGLTRKWWVTGPLLLTELAAAPAEERQTMRAGLALPQRYFTA